MAALDDLNELLAPLPGFALLTDTMKQRALDTSLVPDAAEVWPGQPGYVATYDIYWAAMSLIGFLQAQPVVRQSSSEGTSVAVDAPSWSGILSYYRSQSVIAQASTSSPVLNPIYFDNSHVVRTDMSGRYGDHGDVDTDLG